MKSETEPKGIFITATDTGVGKTAVSAALAMTLKNRGINVAVMKPVTTGCEVADKALYSDDAGLLAWSVGKSVTEEIAPYCFRLPVAPSAAAEAEGKVISLEKVSGIFRSLAASHDFVIVEGAGGLMVPLSGGFLIADLIAKLSIPAVVVARASLGTVNHTILTCFTGKQLGLDIRGVIINGYPENPDEAEKSAPHLIDTLCGAPLLGRFPKISSGDDREVITRLADFIEKSAFSDILFREIGIDSIQR